MARRRERREEERGSEGEADQQDDEMDGRESNRKHKMRPEGGGEDKHWLDVQEGEDFQRKQQVDACLLPQKHQSFHAFIYNPFFKQVIFRKMCPVSRKTYLENEHIKLKQTTTQAHYTVSRLRKTFTFKCDCKHTTKDKLFKCSNEIRKCNVKPSWRSSICSTSFQPKLQQFPSSVRTRGATNVKTVTSRCKHRTWI